MNSMLHCGDLVLSKAIGEFRNMFGKSKEAFWCKTVNIGLGKSTVIVCGAITKAGLYISSVYPCDIYRSCV